MRILDSDSAHPLAKVTGRLSTRGRVVGNVDQMAEMKVEGEKWVRRNEETEIIRDCDSSPNDRDATGLRMIDGEQRTY